MAEDALREPLELLEKLEVELNARQSSLSKLQDYYDGKHRLAFSSEKFRNAFGGMFAAFSDNFMPLVVSAVEERLNVEGFRLGDDPSADRDAWNIWQRNCLDSDSLMAHRESLMKGDAYAIIWGDADGQPRVTIESPRDVIVAYQPGDRKRRMAALKKWKDDEGLHATLFTPDYVFKFEKENGGDWKPDVDDHEPWPLANPLGVVPVVAFTNEPQITSAYGVSEFINVIPQQDALNKILSDMLVASEYIAFPQRYVTGLEIPTDENGNARQPFEISHDKLLIAEDPNARFGTLSAGDLNNYVQAAEVYRHDIAVLTRTPPHYFSSGDSFPSGEAIKSAETGLVAKSRAKMRFYGEAWEEVMRLCFKVLGDARAEAMATETIWADPEYRSESELADALVKRASIGVPRQQLWEDAGYSQVQIARFRAMEAADRFSQILNGTPLMPAVPQALQPAPIDALSDTSDVMPGAEDK